MNSRKPDFTTAATVYWYYVPPRSTVPGYWVSHSIYTIEDALELSKKIKEKADKEQRKLDRETGIGGK